MEKLTVFSDSGNAPLPDPLPQVVQEKLTYVNTHAKLSVDVTLEEIRSAEPVIRAQGVRLGMKAVAAKTRKRYLGRLEVTCRGRTEAIY